MQIDSGYFELRRKLNEAIKVGKYFVTVTYMRNGKLEHFFITKKFPKDDIIPTLEHIAQQVTESESINE